MCPVRFVTYVSGRSRVHSLSGQTLPKSIEFAGRKAANAPAIGTWSIASPPGVVPRVPCFSVGSLASSLSLEPRNRRTSFVGAERNREFELTALRQPVLSILSLSERFAKPGLTAVFRSVGENDDLDFTPRNEEHLDEDFLRTV
jgi:hypothetical protein